MRRIVPFNLLFATMILAIAASSCKMPTAAEIKDYLDPAPENRVFTGAIFYRSAEVAVEVRVSPTCDYDSPRDTSWVLLDVTSAGRFSSASYTLHARAYIFEFRDAVSKDMKRRKTLTPDLAADERTYEYLGQLDWYYDYSNNTFRD